MEFNKNSKLFIRNVYSYDISACHYQVVKKLGLDISHIDEFDKKKRNIQIGLLMRDNQKLVSIIRKTTESIINEYLTINDLTNDDLIIRQYDGFLTQKNLKITSISIPLELKSFFIHMILSFDRKSYLAYDGKDVVIKGVAKKYNGINKILSKVAQMNFINREVIFTTLQKIKDEFLQSDDPFIFAIPIDETNDRYSIYIKKYGDIEVSKGIIDSIDTNDIDKKRYYDFYIAKFAKSIVLEFMK